MKEVILQSCVLNRKVFIKIFSIVFALMMIQSCASRKEAWLSSEKSPHKFLSETTSSLDSLKKEAMVLWTKRVETKSLQQSLQKFEKVHQLNPDDLEVLIYLTRGYYFLGDAHTEDDKVKKKIFEKATSFGELALATNKAFKAKMLAGQKVEDSLDEMTAKEVPAMYWTAASLGKWAKMSGITAALKYKTRIKALIGRVETLWPTYFYSASHRYWGAYFSVAPSFAGGDMNRAKKEFEQSISMSPEYLGTKVLMSELYWSKVGNKQEFKKLLEEVIKTPIDSASELAPENHWEQIKAKKLLAQIDDLF